MEVSERAIEPPSLAGCPGGDEIVFSGFIWG
jgi:hypothetical protein